MVTLGLRGEDNAKTPQPAAHQRQLRETPSVIAPGGSREVIGLRGWDFL